MESPVTLQLLLLLLFTYGMYRLDTADACVQCSAKFRHRRGCPRRHDLDQ